MNIIRNIKVPTGNILITQGEYGKLECLSIGDYGKEKNIKADFMGLSNEINGVPHGDLLPLTEKWVVTISTQYGCSMGCTFCDVPKVGVGRNATYKDMIQEIKACMMLHPEITHTNRLNLHFARMGEPTFNKNVLLVARNFYQWFKDDCRFHPVVSTMMPRKNKHLEQFLTEWMDIKNNLLNGEAGLQLSINSTCTLEREMMFSGNALMLEDIDKIMRKLPAPKGRKITLNFALAGYPIDENELLKFFSPEKYICKITPMHKTAACVESGQLTSDGYEYFYPYKDVESRLKKAGYDVIVFIPSHEEDESRITCGNAILSD